MELSKFISTGIAEGWVRETGNSNIVRVDGQNRDCAVYEVRIDRLHYNVQNGRIATFITRYKMEHGELPEGAEERDKLIEDMIAADNPQRLKATRLDIKAKGQQEVAIILSNGIVVDGNRRFTCLRMLSREEGTPRFLRCYVFPDTYDEKAIKGLELEIQLGRDEKVNYDAISRLVDINTWVNNGPMTKEEYARCAGMKVSEMNKALREIDALNDFLELIDAPGAYHIAQDMKLQGTVESLANKLLNCKDDDEREDLKIIVFSNVLTGNLGDRARAVRDLCDDAVESLRGDGEFADEQLEIAEQVLGKFEGRAENVPVSTEFIRDHVANDTELKGEQKASCEKARMKAGNRKIKNGQVRSVRDAIGSLESVDVELLEKLVPEQLEDMGESLDQVLKLAADLKIKVEDAAAGR